MGIPLIEESDYDPREKFLRPPCVDGRFDLTTHEGITLALNEIAMLVMKEQLDLPTARTLNATCNAARGALEAQRKAASKDIGNPATEGVDTEALPARGPFAPRLVKGGS